MIGRDELTIRRHQHIETLLRPNSDDATKRETATLTALALSSTREALAYLTNDIRPGFLGLHLGGAAMYYVVSFDDCGLDGPLKSRSPIAALALAEEAEKSGCANVVIAAPDGEVMQLSEFAARHRKPN